MPKLTMLRGISGSGKSTEAKKLTQNNNMYRVNRDELRLMLYSGKWSSDKEKAVVLVERAIVKALLENNKSVVVDDTNLLVSHKNMWKQVAENANGIGIIFEVKEIKTPLAECIERDSLRVGKEKIGQAIIERQAIKSGMYNLPDGDKSIVLCDIDGTIANLSHRLHYLENKKDRNRWLKFFAECDKDLPIQLIIDKLHKFKEEGKSIILVTGRASDLTLDTTVKWLKKYNVPYDRLLMRLPGDSRSDVETKNEILNEILLHHSKESIHLVMDDRKCVLDGVWRKAGLPVLAVCGDGPETDF